MRLPGWDGTTMSSQRWWVHKFGGSSVANADCFRRVASIIEQDPRQRVAVVLSACRGVTDQLLGLLAGAERRDEESVQHGLAALKDRHAGIATELLGRSAAVDYVARLTGDLEDIRGVLHTVSLIRAAGENVRDLVSGYGEIWSTRLFAAFLESRGRRSPVALDRCPPGADCRVGPAGAGGGLGRVSGQRQGPSPAG